MKLAVLAALLGSAAVAAAQPAPGDAAARAEVADRSARAHYDLREYAAAIADYRVAFEALPDPVFLFDIAQAYRQLHDCDNARGFYRNYLRERPTADNREKVEQFIAEMDACATTPRDEPRVVVTAPATDHRRLRIAGLVTTAAGLAVSGTGIYFSVEARARARDLEAACAQGCEGAAVAGIDQAGKRARRDAIVAYAVGGATVATGLAMFVWAALHAGGEPPAVVPVPGGATVSAVVRF